ncbi:MAG: PAS-domain containing protein, partial [Pseudomonadota bacterium]
DPEQLRLAQHRNPGDPYDLQMTDGRWVRVHEKRTSDGGIVGIRSDITELKAREAELLRVGNELRRKSMMFETALNNMVQGLCMFDADQTLIVCNKRYLEMYRFSPEVVKPGIKLHEIMAYSVSIGNYSPEDAERAKAARPDHAKLRTQAVLKQYLRDGRVIAVMHQPMPDGGSIATYQDITELEQHETQMVAYTKRLEASNRELQDFAYVASHDLQEPLRKIETFSSRLIAKYSDNLPEQAHTYIERMQNATGRMRLLISDLLSYSRITTKAKPFERIDLNEQLGYVLSDIEIRINENNAVVEAGDLPPIDADPVQIRQLLQNLISNALKFQKPDTQPVVKISSTITPADPVISQPEMIEIRVADNGIGFDNKYKEQIFTIFQRLHGRNEYEGTGIGLATCRKIVERHGGEIDADGVEGVGATFILRLPTRHAQDATRAGSDD